MLWGDPTSIGGAGASSPGGACGLWRLLLGACSGPGFGGSPVSVVPGSSQGSLSGVGMGHQLLLPGLGSRPSQGAVKLPPVGSQCASASPPQGSCSSKLPGSSATGAVPYLAIHPALSRGGKHGCATRDLHRASWVPTSVIILCKTSPGCSVGIASIPGRNGVRSNAKLRAIPHASLNLKSAGWAGRPFLWGGWGAPPLWGRWGAWSSGDDIIVFTTESLLLPKILVFF